MRRDLMNMLHEHLDNISRTDPYRNVTKSQTILMSKLKSHRYKIP